ncbi:MAG: hypothetical protein BWY69_00053 [Planctomycetes bacterium ADurb.Bin401]|nr:MAG: hypothetical protein BWY69_00053 [Planctomycetes bacterium ADurb.Bin401]
MRRIDICRAPLNKLKIIRKLSPRKRRKQRILIFGDSDYRWNFFICNDLASPADNSFELELAIFEFYICHIRQTWHIQFFGDLCRHLRCVAVNRLHSADDIKIVRSAEQFLRDFPDCKRKRIRRCAGIRPAKRFVRQQHRAVAAPRKTITKNLFSRRRSHRQCDNLSFFAAQLIHPVRYRKRMRIKLVDYACKPRPNQRSRFQIKRIVSYLRYVRNLFY